MVQKAMYVQSPDLKSNLAKIEWQFKYLHFAVQKKYLFLKDIVKLNEMIKNKSLLCAYHSHMESIDY